MEVMLILMFPALLIALVLLCEDAVLSVAKWLIDLVGEVLSG